MIKNMTRMIRMIDLCITHGHNKAIVDIRLRPRCSALPTLPSLRSEFSGFYLRLPGILNDPFCCMTLLAIEWSFLQRTSYNALSVGRKTPKIAPSHWYFVTVPKQDRATAVSNKHIRTNTTEKYKKALSRFLRNPHIHLTPWSCSDLRHRLLYSSWVFINIITEKIKLAVVVEQSHRYGHRGGCVSLFASFNAVDSFNASRKSRDLDGIRTASKAADYRLSWRSNYKCNSCHR